MPKYLYFFLLSLLIFLSGRLEAQQLEGGVYAGLSGYQGDLNQGMMFHKISPGAGLLFRVSHTPRLSTRAHAIYSVLRGSDRNTEQTHSNIMEHPAYPDVYYEFETGMIEIGLQGELNLLPYNPRDWLTPLAPYLFLGAGGLFFDPSPMVLSDSGNQRRPAEGVHRHPDDDPGYLNLTFMALAGGGIRFQLNTRLSAGMEFGLRFTGTDYLDEVSHKGDPGKNDRYAFTGFILTYEFDYYRSRGSGRGCPY